MMRPLVGHPVVDAIAEIVVAAGIAEITCAAVAPNPLVQDREAVPAALAPIIAQGLAIRASHRLPFWDSTLVACFDRDERVGPLLDQALRHNPPPQVTWRVTAVNCTAERLTALLSDDGARGHMVALLSAVATTTGEQRHLSMLDFHCPRSPANERLALDAVHALQPGPGYLIASGESYHFIGAALIPDADLPRRLARALLLSPIVDRAWIAHQLLEGRCALRISPKPGEREPPCVVALHDPAAESDAL